MANKYAGTQTEKNLEAAFAGESQARNKYTYFASKAKKDGFEQISSRQPTTKKSTQSSGPKSLKASEAPLKILKLPQTARTTSGQTCMKALQRPPKKRASKRLQPSSALLPQ